MTGFGFSPILKDGGGAGNGETCTHPEPVPEPTPISMNNDFYLLVLAISMNNDVVLEYWFGYVVVLMVVWNTLIY